MPMDQRFVRATLDEVMEGAWVLRVVYSYYGLYEYVETFTLRSLAAAKDRLLTIRCPGESLRITSHDNINIVLAGEGTRS